MSRMSDSSSLKVGSLVLATEQGLGYLAKMFWDNGIFNRAAVIAHGRHGTHWDWYGDKALKINSLTGQRQELFDWASSLDVLLCFETPFVWDLFNPINRCSSKHWPRIILMPMHECFHQQGYKAWHRPDLMLCPSLLDLQTFERNFSCLYLPVPIDQRVKWRQRTRAELFVHNAGHGGLRGRNGTAEFLKALRLVKSKANFLVRSQEPIQGNGGLNTTLGGGHIEYRIGTEPFERLWDEGDVFLFPEKFNGLSLPLQEARAAGMLVMATDRFPNNAYLPHAPLIPTRGSRVERVGPPYQMFDEAIVDPADIAVMIDRWYGKSIEAYSLSGREWGKSMSWDNLGPVYRELMLRVAEGKDVSNVKPVV
jgi:hypothetical protein